MKPTQLIFLLGLTPAILHAQDQKWKAPLEAQKVESRLLTAAEDLEVTVWATSPLLYNPTNIDIDYQGNVWVAEGVNYRSHNGRRAEGDRIAVLRDSNGDGQADSSHTFVQEKGLVAPLGVSVLDNKIIVAQPPHLIVYTDVDRNLVFDPKIDKRETLLSGFNAFNHDHSLHATIGGPDGKITINNGNCGAIFTDKDGKTFRMRSPYRGGGGKYFVDSHKNSDIPSDDGYNYNAGFIARMNLDGTGTEIIGQGFRNSFEHCISSFGTVFQSDNDDPPACRVSYVMEYGNAGFFSRDGRDTWQSDRRPGQSVPVAHWRQESPGTMDAGDIYGSGSPTGVTYYENGALGPKWNGLLLTCEPGRNVIFGYRPEQQGASFKLKRFDFLSSSPGIAHTSDGRRIKAEGDKLSRIQFRPSDVTVGPDGALYVADWYDRRVGGHGDVDKSCSGTIYRIAPKGFKSVIPSIDPNTLEGAITALKSPAKHVRFLGFQRLKARGNKAIPAVKKLLKDSNPYIVARAIYLLPQLGKEGLTITQEFLKSPDERIRLVAFRSLRAAGQDSLSYAQALQNDLSTAIRRDIALSLRGKPLNQIQSILLELYKQWDGKDHNMLEAIGIAVTNHETAFYHWAHTQLNPGPGVTWNSKFTKLAWRLTPPAAVSDFLARAQNSSFDKATRQFSMNAIGFIDSRSALEAMNKLYISGPDKSLAKWWLINRAFSFWHKHEALEIVKKLGIYDPNTKIVSAVSPKPDPSKQIKVSEVLPLKGDPVKGKALAMSCTMCHQINGVGNSYGPNLKGWGTTQTRDVIIRALVNPSADIAHGFDGYKTQLKDKTEIHGRILSSNKSFLRVMSTGGLTQTIPQHKVQRRAKLKRSLMLSADQMGLNAQAVADIVAYLQEYK